jgi:hypothetical protein
MTENVGPTEQKVRMAIGAAATAAAIFAPLEYKWKGVLAAVALTGLSSGATGFSLFKKALGLGR